MKSTGIGFAGGVVPTPDVVLRQHERGKRCRRDLDVALEPQCFNPGQSYFWQVRLVGTVGYRKDWIQS